MKSLFSSLGKITVVFPAYNEEAAIGGVVTGFKQELQYSGLPYEIIVVDNNSKDRTKDIAEAAGAFVIEESSQGYGFACLRGLREATGDTIVLAEADNTFEPRDIWKLLVYLQEEDIDLVLGTRTTKELVNRGAKMSGLLHWGNLLLAKSIQVQFWGRCRLTDVGCTFRAIKRNSLGRILSHIDDGGPSFSPVMIIWSLRMGLKCVEVPIRYKSRLGESKITVNNWKSIRVGLRMLKLIVFQSSWKDS